MSLPGLEKMMTRPVQSLALVALTTFMTSTAIAAESVPKPQTSFTTLPALGGQSEPSLSTINQADYVLGPGDQLQLNMYGQTDLFATPFTVLVDGTISLPFIGRVSVAGKTVREVEANITAMYKRYFKRPYITVVLVKPRQLTLAVSGEVVKPGTYPFVGTDQIPTVSQLLKLSGGITPSADLRNIQVRRTKFGQPENYETINVDLMKLIRAGDISQDVRLRDGDIVVVSASEKPSLIDFQAAANSSFATDNTQPIKIAVIGSVFRPGPYTVQASNAVIGQAGTQGVSTNANNTKTLPTVSQAIQQAGGIKPDADIRNIQIRRLTRAGSEQLLAVDLRKLVVEGDITQDIPIQDGDTVIVTKAPIPLTAEELQFLSDTTFSPATINVNVVGEVTRPGTVQIKPNTPLNTAVLAAGGFDNRRAKKDSVKLIRLNPDGTVTERKIKLAFNAPVNDDTNPPLRNNDVVIVDRSGLAAFSDATSAIFSPITGSLGILRAIPGIGF
ncbi:MAG: SLBB domain-containing protein [Thermosynechococcaceae cyanobacterium]